jgi:hypothetical protein
MRLGQEPGSQPASASEREKLTIAIACGLTFGYLVSLVSRVMAHTWLLDVRGRPVLDDFIAFWASGRMALDGKALSTYDPRLHHAAEVALIGHNFSGSLGWSYPPLFLFVAVLLASFPYAVSFVAWSATTLAAYAAVATAIAQRRAAFIVACAAPWVLTALTPGQNGFLTASIIGLLLLLLEGRPMASGLLLGLLSYKPQFGILFPLALAAGGYWRAFAWAAVGTLAWNGLACVFFGFDTMTAFLHALAGTTQSHLTSDGIGWSKLQSLYALVRSIGGSAATAWTAQALMSVLTVVIVVLAWRGSVPYSLKAAILIAAVPLATPYVFVYDLPMLTMAVAFLFRHRGFDKVEFALLGATIPAIFAFLWLPTPSAFFASLAIAAIATRRLFMTEPLASGIFRGASQSANAPSAMQRIGSPL